MSQTGGPVAAGGVAASVAAGRAAIEAGEFGAAVAALREAARSAPRDAAVRRELGEALAASGDFAAAGAALDEAALLAPGDAMILTDLALVRQMAGDSARARTAIERAAALAPDDPAIRLAQAQLYESLGETALAADTFSEVARVSPTPAVLNNLARTNLALGRWGAADAAFRRLRSLDPESDLVAQHGRIWCQIRRQDWRSALGLALDAARADRYDLTTALLAYARDRLFTLLPEATVAAREAELEARVLTSLREHAELYGADPLGGLPGTGEDGERG